MEQRGERPWLTRNVKVLSGVSLLQDAASEMLYPIMPILLTTTLGAPAAVVGVIEGIAEGVAAALKYVSGRLSDRWGRKPAVAAGYGLAAVGKVVVAGALAWPAVLLGRVVDRVGKGVRGAPRDALLAEQVPESSMGRVYGFHRAADTTGAVVGPLLGLAVLAAADGNLRAALWIAVVPAVISVLLVGLADEGPRPVTTAERPRAAGSGRLPPRVKVVAATLGLIAVVNFPDALLLLRLHEIGWSAQAVVAVYALFNLSNALIAFPAGALADRWPKARVYALGLLCFSAGYTGLALVDSGWIVVALLLVYGGFAGITEGVGRAWISALTPQASRGHAQGLYQGLVGGAVLIAGLWAGLLWHVGPGSGTIPLLISGCVGLLAAGALILAGRRLEPRGPRVPS